MGAGVGGRLGGGLKTGSWAPTVDPHLGIGISDNVSIEGWGELSHGQALLGMGALRLTYDLTEGIRRGGAFDVAAGFGGGVGGVLCGNLSESTAARIQEDRDEDSGVLSTNGVPVCESGWPDGVSWDERSVYAGHLDFGLGGWFTSRPRVRIGIFARPSFDVSVAEGIPITTWATIKEVTHFDFGVVQLVLSAGFTWYFLSEEIDTEVGFDITFSAGLSFRLGKIRKPKESSETKVNDVSRLQK
ncbi:MAG: hypothetical protein GY854_03265 [Deltaproteobacteria bacterium]|nr:hypothetical protein [Deltaproteobacteria bacterium]